MSKAQVLMSLQDRVINQEIMATPEMIALLAGNSVLNTEVDDDVLDNCSGVVCAGLGVVGVSSKECTTDARRLRTRKTANG